MNTILHERRLEEYFCTLCYAAFDLKRRQLTMANSGLPYPVRRTGGKSSEIELAGVPLGLFAETSYEELTLDLKAGDVYVFCSDGIVDTTDLLERDFGVGRLIKVIDRLHQESAEKIVDGIFEAVGTFRAGAPLRDDMTAVVVKITT
jgi:sigma-B regulation protein RsbU (phosphoserine phosphatase)